MAPCDFKRARALALSEARSARTKKLGAKIREPPATLITRAPRVRLVTARPRDDQDSVHLFNAFAPKGATGLVEVCHAKERPRAWRQLDRDCRAPWPRTIFSALFLSSTSPERAQSLSYHWDQCAHNTVRLAPHPPLYSSCLQQRAARASRYTRTQHNGRAAAAHRRRRRRRPLADVALRARAPGAHRGQPQAHG